MAPRLYPLMIFMVALTGTSYYSKPAYANEHQPRLVELLKFSAPSASGPYPIVVLVSSCEGFKSEWYDNTEDRLNAIGYATARVDFMGARGVGGCTNRPSKSRVARDILYILEHLSGVDAVKHSAINVLAWSSGGGAALNMMSKLEEASDIQLASVSVYYPRCTNVFPWSSDVPVLMLLGSADDLAPAAICENVATKSPGANIQIEEYANAYHYFDDPSLPLKSVFSSGTMGYHKKAAEKAWVALTNFLIQ